MRWRVCEDVRKDVKACWEVGVLMEGLWGGKGRDGGTANGGIGVEGL